MRSGLDVSSDADVSTQDLLADGHNDTTTLDGTVLAEGEGGGDKLGVVSLGTGDELSVGDTVDVVELHGKLVMGKRGVEDQPSESLDVPGAE